MTIYSLTAKFVLALGLASTMHIASATTYTNLKDMNPQRNIGGTFSNHAIGQIFKAPGGTLQSFEFYAVSGVGGWGAFSILALGGGSVAGNNVYSTPLTYSGGAQTLSFNNISLALKPDTEYLAFISGTGGTGSLQNLVLHGSDSDGGLVGVARIRYFPSGWWLPTNAKSLAFTASITSAVPEPETYAMLLTGLGLIGWMNRRKRQAKKFS